MQLRLARRRQPSRDHVGVQIAEQQRALEKYQASGPHRSRPAETRKNQFGEQRFDQKKKKRAEKNRRGEQHHMQAGNRQCWCIRFTLWPFSILSLETRSGLCALGVNSFSSFPLKSGNSTAFRRWPSHRVGRFSESVLQG